MNTPSTKDEFVAPNDGTAAIPTKMADDKVAVAYVPCATGGVINTRMLPWPKLAEGLNKIEIGKKDGRGWLPALIEPGSRTSARVQHISALVLDIEARCDDVKDASGNAMVDAHGDRLKQSRGNEPPDVETMLAELSLCGWRCILHTSYGHLNPATLPVGIEHPRYRIIFALSRPLAVQQYIAIAIARRSRLGQGARLWVCRRRHR